MRATITSILASLAIMAAITKGIWMLRGISGTGAFACVCAFQCSAPPETAGTGQIYACISFRHNPCHRHLRQRQVSRAGNLMTGAHPYNPCSHLSSLARQIVSILRVTAKAAVRSVVTQFCGTDGPRLRKAHPLFLKLRQTGNHSTRSGQAPNRLRFGPEPDGKAPPGQEVSPDQK